MAEIHIVDPMGDRSAGFMIIWGLTLCGQRRRDGFVNVLPLGPLERTTCETCMAAVVQEAVKGITDDRIFFMVEFMHLPADLVPDWP